MYCCYLEKGIAYKAMERIGLAKHIKHGDTFYTPLTDPERFGANLKLTSWSNCWLPEYFWIAMILHEQGRTSGFVSLSSIMKELKTNDIAIPQMSKIIALEKNKQELFWKIVSRFVKHNTLAPLAVIISPDINDVFYNRYFDFSMNFDTCIAHIMDVIKNCLRFHDELSTDICFIADWFYVTNGRLYIHDSLEILPKALTEYHKCSHSDEVMRMYRPIIRSTFQTINGIEERAGFPDLFWKVLSKVSNCNPLVMEWSEDTSMGFLNVVIDTMEYFSVTNEHQKTDTKYCVIMGMVCYIFKL